eukprot:196375-Lingulodinium_polyedra.AAC.1
MAVTRVTLQMPATKWAPTSTNKTQLQWPPKCPAAKRGVDTAATLANTYLATSANSGQRTRQRQIGRGN